MPARYREDSSKLVLILAYLLLSPGLVHTAEIYKWVDDKGRIHYGDKPVDSNTTRQIEVNPATTTPDDAASRLQRQQRVLKAMQQRRAEQQRAREQKQAQLQADKRRRDNCNKMRDQLTDYETARKQWYELDAQGNRHFLTPEKLEQYKSGLRKDIRQYCGNKY